MPVSLFDWQEASAAELQLSLTQHSVASDGSDTGTGKTIKACVVAKRLGRPMFVVCPKSVMPDWRFWAEQTGATLLDVINYEGARAGKSGYGRWSVPKKVFEWTLPPGAILFFDEAHRLAGKETQTSRMLVAAVRQGIPHALMSATLIESPLKAWAIGYSLGLHRLTNFWPWARSKGVVQGPWGPEWRPKKGTPTYVAIMEGIRQTLGTKFTRIRKADVPGFPMCQVIPTLVPTEEMPEFESDFGSEARQAVELLKVAPIVERTKDAVAEGNSVAIFVNFLATLAALREAFPKASLIVGGQSSTDRVTNINKFQQNENHVILVMAQAGGTGVSLHDLHGRPRIAFISPGYSAVEFLQVLGRIHRAGSLSPAINYVVLASGVPIERRIRQRLDAKLNNLAALNDSDFDPSSVTNCNNEPTNPLPETPQLAGALRADLGTAQPPLLGVPDQRRVDRSAPAHAGNGRPSLDQDRDAGRSGSPGSRGDGVGPAPEEGADYPARPGEYSDSYPAGYAGSGRAQDPGGEVVQSGGQGVVHPSSRGLDDRQAGRGRQVVKLLKPTEPAKPTLAQKMEAGAAKDADATGNHVVRTHARCSPSKLKNLEICPSYRGNDDGVVHPITLRGTAMHEAMETNDDSQLIEADGEPALVAMCREFLAPEIAAAETNIDEQHLKTHDPDVQGFVDKVLILPKDPVTGRRKALIRDYKMGFNLVDLPHINPQAVAYTVGVFLQWEDVDEVNFAFLIPRQDAVLEHTFYRKDLAELQVRLSVIADSVRKGAGKVFNPNFENCLYCGFKSDCAKLREMVLPLARSANEKQLTLPASLAPAEVYEPQQVAQMLDVAAIVEDWSKQARSAALRFRLENGVEIPGYDLVQRSAKREIADPVKAFEVARDDFGVTLPEFMTTCKTSITSLDKLIQEHAPRGEKAKASEAYTDKLEEAMALTRGMPFHVLQRSRKKKSELVVS